MLRSSGNFFSIFILWVVIMSIDTGGRLVNSGEVCQENIPESRKTIPIGVRVFDQGDTDPISDPHTLSPHTNEAWVVHLYGMQELLDADRVIVTKRLGNARHIPRGECITSMDELNDFMQLNGYIPMQLGGNLWELNNKTNMLVITIPSTYVFMCSNTDMLQRIILEYEKVPLDTLKIPETYYAGVL